jgi:dTDP-3,4-didehydro-2,6-dideoxy-alpha-D-glucose 3-reductase
VNFIVIGWSRIATRRVIPALRRIKDVEQIDLASRRATDPALHDSWVHGEVFTDYAAAFDGTKAEVAYISLVNSEHERWAEFALNRGLHVIVDKPAVLGIEAATRLAKLARHMDRCLAQATVFALHPQIALVKQLFADAGSRPSRLSMTLSFPPFEPSDFRYRRELGGGALWDLGPYLAACGRVFFQSEPTAADCRILARIETGVEIAFSALGTFPGDRGLTCHCGFDTAYVNRLQVLGPDVMVEFDRAFTTPPDLVNRLRVYTSEGTRSVDVRAADSFECFLQNVVDRIKTHNWSDLSAELISDLNVLDRYRAVAESS